MNSMWIVKYTAERRSNGELVTVITQVNARTQIEAEDLGLRKCKLFGHKNCGVSAERA